MNCLTCQDHFTALLEPEADAAEARAHLDECPACAVSFADFTSTVRHLRALPVVSPPAGLLGQISRALDETSVAPSARGALWQPVTAGFAMAACLVVVLWSAVLHPVNSGREPVSSQVTYPTAGLEGAGVAGTPATPQAPAPRGGRDVAPRTRAARRAGWKPALPARGGGAAVTKLPDFGSWGKKLAPISSTDAGAGIDPATGKPVGTFAAGDPAPPVAPLVRRAGEIQLAFAPPMDKPVGATVVGQLTITSQAEAMVTVRAEPRAGLLVTNAPEGVLYQGAIRHGESRVVPVRLRALRPGTQRVRVWLESDVLGVAGDLEVVVPGFVGEVGKNEGRPVSLRFHETPSLQAIRELAAAAGERVVVHEDVETRRVTLDFSAGVPFAAALQVLCDECGYRIENRDRVYHIMR